MPEKRVRTTSLEKLLLNLNDIRKRDGSIPLLFDQVQDSSFEREFLFPQYLPIAGNVPDIDDDHSNHISFPQVFPAQDSARQENYGGSQEHDHGECPPTRTSTRFTPRSRFFDRDIFLITLSLFLGDRIEISLFTMVDIEAVLGRDAAGGHHA